MWRGNLGGTVEILHDMFTVSGSNNKWSKSSFSQIEPLFRLSGKCVMRRRHFESSRIHVLAKFVSFPQTLSTVWKNRRPSDPSVVSFFVEESELWLLRWHLVRTCPPPGQLIALRKLQRKRLKTSVTTEISFLRVFVILAKDLSIFSWDQRLLI